MARRVVKDDMDDLLGWAVGFRRSVRGALWPYYPNNPMSGDEELLSAIRDLVALWKEQGKPTPAWKTRVETYRKRVKWRSGMRDRKVFEFLRAKALECPIRKRDGPVRVEGFGARTDFIVSHLSYTYYVKTQ